MQKNFALFRALVANRMKILQEEKEFCRNIPVFRIGTELAL